MKPVIFVKVRDYSKIKVKTIWVNFPRFIKNWLNPKYLKYFKINNVIINS